jgi:hypothetical protein
MEWQRGVATTPVLFLFLSPAPITTRERNMRVGSKRLEHRLCNAQKRRNQSSV